MASKNVVEFTSDNWQAEVVQSGQPVLVDFWAPWCGPCRQLSPIVDRVADQFAGKVKVGKLNVDSSPGVAGRFGVFSIPTLLLFVDGEEKARMVGVRRRDAILAEIGPHLSSPATA